MKVKIIKADNKVWYKNQIGCVYNVIQTYLSYYIIDGYREGSSIFHGDCEVIENTNNFRYDSNSFLRELNSLLLDVISFQVSFLKQIKETRLQNLNDNEAMKRVNIVHLSRLFGCLNTTTNIIKMHLVEFPENKVLVRELFNKVRKNQVQNENKL